MGPGTSDRYALNNSNMSDYIYFLIIITRKWSSIKTHQAEKRKYRDAAKYSLIDSI